VVIVETFMVVAMEEAERQCSAEAATMECVLSLDSSLLYIVSRRPTITPWSFPMTYGRPRNKQGRYRERNAPVRKVYVT
jgi:hypothetical protein